MTMISQRRAEPLSTAPWFGSLPEAWQTMTDLRGQLPPRTREVRSAGLAMAINIVRDALYLPGPGGQRRVPSAGAIFPYTTMVLASEDHRSGPPCWSLFQVGADGHITEVPADPALISKLAAAITPNTDEHAVEGHPAHLLVLNRPWMSIRKYGPRGYLYSRLDAAHALVNLLGIALESGHAWLRLNCGGEAAEDLLIEQAGYHELFGVVSVRGGSKAASTVVEMIEAHTEAEPAKVPAGETLEAVCWSLLGDLVGLGTPGSSVVTTAALHPGSAIEAEHDLRPTGRWSQASARRRSARRFGGPPLAADRIAATLSALGTELPMNLQPDGASSLEFTVFVANPLDSEATLNWSLGRYGRVVTARGTDRAVLAAACMGQQHLLDASAFVLISASRRRLLYEGQAEFEETLFRAGASGQLMYLGATRAGVGITTIGGFDSARWSELAGLRKDHELLYLAALGNEVASNAPKLDRDAPALAHGER